MSDQQAGRLEGRQALNAAIAVCAQQFAETRDLDVILKNAVRIIRHEIGLDRAGIFLYDHEEKLWHGVFGTDAEGFLRDEHNLNMPRNPQHPIYRAERGEGDEFFYDDFSAAFPEDPFMAHVKNCFFVVLRAHGHLLGGISVDNLESGCAVDEDTREDLRRFSRYLALALENRGLLNRLESANRRLERANKDLTEFADVMAHDLTSPLQGVTLLLEVVLRQYRKDLPEDARDKLQKALERVLRLGRLLQGILRYSRMGKREGETVLLSTRQLVGEVVEFLEIPKGLSVTVADDLPSVIYDQAQLHQVFQNLISNAVKYMGREEGHIDVFCEKRPADWMFCVRDDGQGISERYHLEIFKMFNRGNREDDGASCGMGLALVKKIVERGGGEVWVESKEGQGTSFYFTIPAPSIRRVSGG
ncbi:MAG: ATP-binding protein [Kiritimatiellae bacterium]|nr:ATP-binding protein [Kiritimatiellia bacterium]MDD4734908.1 ATP-binding protein [Kiritimatiellia bacterium]